MKNRIINGAMVISQAANGATINPPVSTGTGNYPVDRFYVAVSQTSKLTTAQASTSGAALAAGFNKCTNVTVTSAYTVGASEVFVLQQRIEGYNVADLVFGTASAKTITLSFWVNCSVTGAFGGVVLGASGTRSYPFSYTVNAANTWEQKTVTIAGCTDGTWVTNNGNGMLLAWSLGVGSTFTTTANAWATGEYYNSTGGQSLVATNGATWNITGVQLEVGSSATSFDYRQYGTELMLCQRYYQTCYDIGQTPGSNVGTGIQFSWASANTASIAGGAVTLSTSMRTIPSVTIYDRVGNAGKATGFSQGANATENVSLNSVDYNTRYIWPRFYANGYYGMGFNYVASAEL
jgi:hypothetical protein